MKKRNLKAMILAAVVVTAAPAAAQAQWWERHPAYLHAMSDLRSAYWLVNHREPLDPVANDEERHAMGEIRAAYKELKDASIVDKKDIDDQPPADTNFYDHAGRLHHALDLLREAHNDINGEEDDRAARGLKQRAVGHIDEAARWTDAAIHAWHF